jgi:hypothetical protein
MTTEGRQPLSIPLFDRQITEVLFETQGRFRRDL